MSIINKGVKTKTIKTMFSPFLSKTKTKSIRGDIKHVPIKKYVNEVPLDTNLKKNENNILIPIEINVHFKHMISIEIIIFYHKVREQNTN